MLSKLLFLALPSNHTFKPAWPALMAATYPATPPPMMRRSFSSAKDQHVLSGVYLLKPTAYRQVSRSPVSAISALATAKFPEMSANARSVGLFEAPYAQKPGGRDC